MLLVDGLREVLNLASLVFGLLMLQIWFERRKEAAIGFFGLLTVLSGVRMALYFAEQPFVLWPVMDWFFYSVNCWFVALLGYFSIDFASRRTPRYSRALWGLALAFPALAAVAMLGGEMATMRAWSYPFVIALAVPAIVLTLAEARRRGERTLIALSLSFGGMALAAFHDYLLSLGLLSARDTYWMVYALPIGFLIFGVHLVSRLVKAVNEVEQFNVTLEDRVAERTRQLEEANAAKTRFLASASHDLRQPVHTVGLLMGLLREKTKDPSVKSLVERMRRAIASLEHLLNGLLDLSKLDADVVRADIRMTRLHDVLMVVRVRHEIDAEDKGLQLRLRPTDAVVSTDPVILERILDNLVSNAVRYTEEGGVLIGVRRAGRRAVRVEVHDTGIGVPVAAREQIFQEFYQVGNVQRDRSKGLGLGLSIVRRLAHLLGHPVSLRQRKGGGSCFAVTVPRARHGLRRMPPPAPASAVPSIAGLFVALIEDEADVRESTVRLLVHNNCKVLAVADADQLLVAMASLARTPDILLSDYRLADGDGVEAVQRVRQVVGHTLPALLLTGSTAPADVLRYQAAGIEVCSSHLVLPNCVRPWSPK